MIPFSHATGKALTDRNYYDFVLGCVEAARSKIWVSVFICDIRPHRDVEGHVLRLLTTLATKKDTGVDVRLLLPGIVRTPEIDIANLSTGILAAERGLRVRRLFTDGARVSTHSKFLVCDDIAVLGSQNWSDDAFRLNIEESVVLKGEPVDMLAHEFLRLWSIAKGMPRK